MKMHQKLLWLALPIMLLAAGSVLAGPKKVGPNHGAPKNVTECGTALTEPGNYKLVNDLLDCPAAVDDSELGGGVAILGSDISLNLNGHEISCADGQGDTAFSGIFVSAPCNPYFEDCEGISIKNVTIKNGTVSNCHDGIVLVLTEDSKVMHMGSKENRTYWVWDGDPDNVGVPGYGEWRARYGTGITVWYSRNNVIMHNHTDDNASHGIGSWNSSGNLFKHNTSTGNGDGWSGGGINLFAEKNSRVMCNRVHGNSDGITIWPGESGSSGNLLRGNHVSDNVTTGIGMFGYYWQDPDSGVEYYYAMPSGNTIRMNIVENNPWIDLFEAHWVDDLEVLQPNPDGICRNSWEKNQFQTETGVADCIGPPVELDEKDVCAVYDDN